MNPRIKGHWCRMVWSKFHNRSSGAFGVMHSYQDGVEITAPEAIRRGAKAVSSLGRVRASLFAMVVSLSVSQASASEWWMIGDDEHDVRFMDRQSVSRLSYPNNSTYSVWVKRKFYRPDDSGIDSDTVLAHLDCSKNEIAVRTTVSYDKAGNVKSSYSSSEYALSYSPIIPDSWGEIYRKFVCGTATSNDGSTVVIDGESFYRVADIDKLVGLFASLHPAKRSRPTAPSANPRSTGVVTRKR